MITFLSLFGILFGMAAGNILTALDEYDVHTYRWTDLLVVVPFFGGIAGVIYVLLDLMVRYLP